MTKELAGKIAIPQADGGGGEGDVVIIVQCAATCTGTVGKVELVGDGLKTEANLEKLRKALSYIVNNFSDIETEFLNLP
ncbi:MAG TPA: hypothetical protein VEW48_16540 [Thermoanaerobaculia bacterium]|nr:hypothetical protein [Thermoanaerobaculia bacterium]